MRSVQIKLLFLACFAFLNQSYAQNTSKSYLEQGLEYYFVTQKLDKAIRVLDTLQKSHDFKSVNLDYAIKAAVKYKRNDLLVPLLEELYGDFSEDVLSTGKNVGAWLGDTSFNFADYFGKKWPSVSKSLQLKKQTFEDNLKSEYYSSLQNFLSVDQFVRLNKVSPATFKQVDSLNMDNFCNWLLEVPQDGHIKSRLNNQILVTLLRHLGAKRFQKLSDKQVFTHLMAKEIISAQDYGLMYDYLHPKPLYFIEYDAFVEKSWAKSGIKTRAEILALDQHRSSIGLLPIEYSGFCLQKGISVPESLLYADPIEFYVFVRK